MELRVTALVLAAGLSTRMGTSKQLLRLGNKSVIRVCVDTLTEAGIKNIIVVCGAMYDAFAEELQGSSAAIARNEAMNSQMADSVRVGLRAVDERCSGVLVCLADHPLVSCSTYRTMINAYTQTPERIIVPAFEGKRGHPTLFPFPVISDIFYHHTLRDLIREESDRVLMVDVPDEGIILDMDTEEDYRVIAARFAARTDGVRSGE